MRDTKDGELKDPEWTESEVGEVRGSSGDGGGEMGGGCKKQKRKQIQSFAATAAFEGS